MRRNLIVSGTLAVLIGGCLMGVTGCAKSDADAGGKPTADALKKFRGASSIDEIPPKYRAMAEAYRKQNAAHKAPTVVKP